MLDLLQWRRSELNTETELIECLQKFVSLVREIFPDKLQEVILYGSYAKGTWQDDSDVDVALIMDGVSIKDVVDKVVDIAVDLENSNGFFISPIGIEAEFFNTDNCRPLYKNIRNEGIVIWKKN